MSPSISWIQSFLQFLVEVYSTHGSPVHRGKNLDLDIIRVITKSLRDHFPNEFDDHFYDLYWILLLDEIEVIKIPPCRCQIRDSALIDGVGIHDNGAFPGLAEYLVQIDDRGHPGNDNVPEHIAGTDGQGDGLHRLP